MGPDRAMGRSFKIKDSEKPKLRAVLVKGYKPHQTKTAAEPEDESKARFKTETLATINVYTDAPSLASGGTPMRRNQRAA
jgi:D-serine deaminase-like pyridoxal phosphate-dependent protein